MENIYLKSFITINLTLKSNVYVTFDAKSKTTTELNLISNI